MDDLPSEVRAALETAISGNGIALTRSGSPIGSLEFRPIALEGTVIDGPLQPSPPTQIPDGVTVIATTMSLSEAARQRLSDELGTEYIVLDITKAPTSSDVLLTHPVSPQLLGMLQHKFPSARVVITEIEDEELGVRFPGPVSRLLDAGASAYLPPRPIAELARNVHLYLTQREQPTLEQAPRPRHGLSRAEERQIGS
ncbi:hypothetical protein [Sinomonas albida]|uniref:hypothetical protein n=1 Tax=Sinomonas albida TaxID=369942 RepID=UPI0030168708